MKNVEAGNYINKYENTTVLAAVSVSFKLKYWKFPYLGSGKVTL